MWVVSGAGMSSASSRTACTSASRRETRPAWTKVFSFYDAPSAGIGELETNVRFMAEAFLVQDTGTKNAAGKDVVNIFGGIKWGWQVQEVAS